MKKLVKILLKPFLGKTIWQPFFERLHFFALKGMNVGRGSYLSDSGEAFAIGYALKKLTADHQLAFFDVGANVGDYSEELLKQLGGKNFVIHAFEPSAHAFTKLSTQFGGNQRVKLHHFALGSKSADAELFSDQPGSGLSSLIKRDISHVGLNFENRQAIKVKTLDEFCAENNISRIDFLKMDVEGYEMEVLAGAGKMLEGKHIHFVQFEFGGADIDARIFFRDFYRLLNPNYKIYRILADGLRTIAKYKEEQEIFITTNFLCELR